MGKEAVKKAPGGAKATAKRTEAGKDAGGAAGKAGGKAQAPAKRIGARRGVREALGKARAFARRIVVKMLANGFTAFTVVFVTVASVMLVWEFVPWITREGVTDIDPLPILVLSFLIAFSAASLRYNVMKKFSRIRP